MTQLLEPLLLQKQLPMQLCLFEDTMAAEHR
jgi:hypothetical protein